jgi:hypothetical protein
MTIPPVVLGPIDDYWFRWATDVGIAGPDKGKEGEISITAAWLYR